MPADATQGVKLESTIFISRLLTITADLQRLRYYKGSTLTKVDIIVPKWYTHTRQSNLQQLQLCGISKETLWNLC